MGTVLERPPGPADCFAQCYSEPLTRLVLGKEQESLRTSMTVDLHIEVRI